MNDKSSMKRSVLLACILCAFVRAESASFDVAVVGAGPAGIAAALCAARTGARTVLVERSSAVGGTAVLSGVTNLGLFHAWGRQIVDGPCWEVVTNAVALDTGRLPDFRRPMGRDHNSHCVRVNPYVYSAVAEEALRKAGVELRLLTFPVKVSGLSPEGVRTITLQSDAGAQEIAVRQVVDATGNAAVALMAGASVVREPEASRQPGTYFFRLDSKGLSFDAAALDKAQRAALEAGELEPTDVVIPMSAFVRQSGGWGNYVHGADNSTAQTRSETNWKGRAAMLRVLRFLRRQPGLEKVRIVFAERETGVRETVRIVGDAIVTEADYVAGRVFPDALCYSYWMIDAHDALGKASKLLYLEPERVATVPLGALIPKGVNGLLAAGRSVSSDHLANSALRVQGSCMAMGQVAGVAASLAARAGCDVRALEVPRIREALANLCAVVPD